MHTSLHNATRCGVMLSRIAPREWEPYRNALEQQCAVRWPASVFAQSNARARLSGCRELEDSRLRPCPSVRTRVPRPRWCASMPGR